MKPIHDLKAIHAAWSSRPLVQVTTARTSGGEPLVQIGHAFRDEFIPAGRDLDAALEQAIELSRSSRHPLYPEDPASRGYAVLQARNGELYLTGLNSDPFLPEAVERGLELRDGVIGRTGLWDTARPSWQTNQLTSPDIYMGATDASFGASSFRKLVDELVAIAGPDRALRLS